MVTTPLQTRPALAQSADSIERKLRRCKGTRFVEKFWLDMQKHDERWLRQQITILKYERQYSRAVRDGLRLFLDLRQGRLEVLMELFPFVQERMDNMIKDRIIQVQADMIRSFTVAAPAAQPALRPVTAPDDDGPLVVTKAKSDGKSALNFLDSAFKLVQ